MLRIIHNRKWYFGFSGILVVLSIVAIATFGLRLGIDFTGGSLIEVHVQELATEDLKGQLESEGFAVSSVQPTGSENYLIRTEPLNENNHQRLVAAIAGDLTDEQKVTFEELRFESIGPTIGNELKQKAVSALITSLIAIILYIAWAFRKVSKPVQSWKYGIGAIVALAHDVIIITGIFALLGHLYAVEINILFVTALLTIIGFSVHDTIVVYDRTRENLTSSGRDDFENTVNRSVNETLTRSINTSITTLFVLVTLYFFGGTSIQHFVLALIFGILVGTYSSIFIASPLLLVWQRFSKRR